MTRNHTETEMTTTGETEKTLTDTELCPPFFETRAGLPRSFKTFRKTQRGRIAYLGGSITTMAGWRVLTYPLFEKFFPDTEFGFVDAGIGGTNSTYGAFRFQQDVWKNGPVDLLFIEFAVNDNSEPGPDNRRGPAMEGIIRHARTLNPDIDIVIQYLADEVKLASYNNRRLPTVIADHDTVARHYDIPIINQALMVRQRIENGVLAWSDFARDACHPRPLGHEAYANHIAEFLTAVQEENATPSPFAMPPPLLADAMERAELIHTGHATILSNWQQVNGWEAEKTCNYNGPVDILAATTPGASLTLSFTGASLYISAIAGMDAGRLRIQVDNGVATCAELFDQHCPNFHRPVFRCLAQGLPSGEHTAIITIDADHHPDSRGHACRILQFGTA